MCIKPPKVEIPAAPNETRTLEQRKLRVKSAAEKQRQLAGAGIQSTILTGPTAQQGKTLLGQ